MVHPSLEPYVKPCAPSPTPSSLVSADERRAAYAKKRASANRAAIRRRWIDS